MPDVFPPPREVVEILEDPDCFKIGIVPGQDGTRLYNDYGVNVRGCVDLQWMAKRDNCGRPGMAGQALYYLNLKVPKSKSMTPEEQEETVLSNWEAEELSFKQIRYAALDGAIPMRILFAMLAMEIETRDASFCYDVQPEDEELGLGVGVGLELLATEMLKEDARKGDYQTGAEKNTYMARGQWVDELSLNYRCDDEQPETTWVDTDEEEPEIFTREDGSKFIIA